MSDYKVKAWSWCADYCKRNQWNPHDSYFWDKAMLQYRRDNNIFEVGDFIVYGSITVLFVVEQEGTPMLLRHSKTGRIFRKPVGGNMRHATPEEIKEGKRL